MIIIYTYTILVYILQLWVKLFHNSFSINPTLALNNLQRLICHETKKPNQLIMSIYICMCVCVCVFVYTNMHTPINFPILLI